MRRILLLGVSIALLGGVAAAQTATPLPGSEPDAQTMPLDPPSGEGQAPALQPDFDDMEDDIDGEGALSSSGEASDEERDRRADRMRDRSERRADRMREREDRRDRRDAGRRDRGASGMDRGMAGRYPHHGMGPGMHDGMGMPGMGMMMHDSPDSKAARFTFDSGSGQGRITIRCAEDDSTRHCAEAVLPLLQIVLPNRNDGAAGQ